MTEASDESTDETRERLEHEADETRARLLDDLGTLDERRDRVKRLLERAGDEARRHKALLVGVGVGLLVTVGLIALARRRRARRNSSSLFAQALKNLLGPGYVIESVERHDRRRNGTVARAAFRVATEIGKRSLPLWLQTNPDERENGASFRIV